MWLRSEYTHFLYSSSKHSLITITKITNLIFSCIYKVHILLRFLKVRIYLGFLVWCILLIQRDFQTYCEFTHVCGFLVWFHECNINTFDVCTMKFYFPQKHAYFIGNNKIIKTWFKCNFSQFSFCIVFLKCRFRGYS